MIHWHDGEFVISAQQVWRPGCFESRKAAWHGQRLTDEQIQALQDQANERAGGDGGVITLADIAQCKKTILGGGQCP